MAVESDVKDILTELGNAREKATNRERKLDGLVVDLADIKVTQIEFGNIQSRVIERLAGIDKKQDEQAVKQDKVNDKLGDHGEALASIAEWKTGHKDTHDTMCKEIDKAVNRSNWALRLEAVTTAITAGLGTIAGLGGGGS